MGDKDYREEVAELEARMRVTSPYLVAKKIAADRRLLEKRIIELENRTCRWNISPLGILWQCGRQGRLLTAPKRILFVLVYHKEAVLFCPGCGGRIVVEE